MNKPKVIKDFSKLPEELQEEILDKYPNGYEENLILFTDRDGKYAHALPYETEDKYYLLRMPALRSKKEDDDEEIDENEDEASSYTDLDTMQIGGSRKNEDNEEYD